jgi:glycosyltransferase involved in cell wall biosynthesis
MVSVTIVTIFFDAEKYLGEAIASVFAQTFDDWELILVDDGSTDGGSVLARQCAERHPDRVRYLEHFGHANRGMSVSRNLGILAASGEFVALLDADDVWFPEKLSRQVAILHNNPDAVMVYDATRRWHSWSGEPGAESREGLRRLGLSPETLVQPPTLIPLFLNGEAESPGTCSVLIRRSAFEQVGGFVESFRGMFEDQAFFFKVCLELPVYLSGGVTALYRQHPESACQIATRLGLYDPECKDSPTQEVFLNWLAEYVSRRLTSKNSASRRLPAAIKDELLCRLGFAPAHRIRRFARRVAGRSPMVRRLLALRRRFRHPVH